MMFEETYISTIRQSEDEIKEYQAQRKKLESRRLVCVALRQWAMADAIDLSLSFDAAAAKLDKLKHAKKVQEKDLQEAEDEYDDAKAR